MKKSTILIILLQFLLINLFAFAYPDSLEISVWNPGLKAGRPSLSDCPLQKGAFLINPLTGLSLGSNKYSGFVDNNMTSESKSSAFNMDIEGGWFLGRSFVLGGYFGVASSSRKINEFYKTTSLLVKLGPYARLYVPLNGKVQPFADFLAAIGLGSEKEKYDNPDINTSEGLGFFGLGLGLGASVFLSEQFALDFKLAFDIDSLARSDGNFSTAYVNQFFGVKTGFNIFLN